MGRGSRPTQVVGREPEGDCSPLYTDKGFSYVVSFFGNSSLLVFVIHFRCGR